MSANATANDETQVNATSTGEQSDPSITALADGGWVVVWKQFIPGDKNVTVFQRYGADGTAVGAETRVSLEDTVSGQVDPVVTALADGGFVIAWEDQFAGEFNSGVFTQRYDADGVAQGSIEFVSFSGVINKTLPSITTLDDGGWVVTWTQDTGIFQQRFDDEGATVGATTQVNSVDGDAFGDVSVVALSDGGWIVAWQDGDADQTGVFFQRFNADGSVDGTQTQANTTTASGQENVAVSTLADGGWLLTWETGGSQDGSGSGIYQRRFNAQGAAVTGEVQVNSTTAGDQGNASVTTLADGGWVIAWQSADEDGAGIFLQRYDADGNRVGTETLVNAETANQQTEPVVTALPGGGFVVSWISEGQDGALSGIFQRVFAADIEGSGANDTLTGTAFDETLRSFAGNDTLNGGAGADRMEGDNGNDVYIVDNVGDVVVEGFETGTDTVRASIAHTLAANVENLVLTGTGNLNGTGNSLNNAITGNGGVNTLNGGSGNDSLNGGAGNDRLLGGVGNDSLNGATGADRMEGGAGNDTYFVDNAGDRVVEGANAGTDTVRASMTQTLAANVENLVLLGTGSIAGTGNTLANALTGNTGNNRLTAGAGNDTLTGLGGNDTLLGDAGNDRLSGDAGNDVLTGGIGADSLFGGTGADRFVFTSVAESTFAVSGRDTILDFSRAQGDRIDLSALDANSRIAGDQAFSLIGEAGFSGVAGQLRYVNSNGDTFLQADVNGDRAADFAIRVDANIDFIRGDFIL